MADAVWAAFNLGMLVACTRLRNSALDNDTVAVRLARRRVAALLEEEGARLAEK